ncbi:MAG: TrkA family potassium uptake protein [Rikenellaceae bacterium]
MKYVVIGLGNFGSVLAEELSMLGHEVVGADLDANNVDKIKDKIATVFKVDATDSQSILSLPLKGADVVIVTVGENFGASVKIVALLKKAQVKSIYARAIDDIHEEILRAFDVDRILKPESDAAKQLVQSMDLGVEVNAFKVDKEYYVTMFPVVEKMWDLHVSELTIEQDFNIKIIGIKRAEHINNFLGISVLERKVVNTLEADYVLQSGDVLVCYGRYQDFRKLWKAI